MDKQQARRNRLMGDWIRAGISSPTMPLEAPTPSDASDAAAGASSGHIPSADGGAGTRGGYGEQHESFSDAIRRSMAEGKQRH